MNFPQRKHDDVPPTDAPDVSGFDDPKAAPFKIPKFAKYLAGTALGLVLIAGVGGVIVSQAVDQAKYKEMIVTKVKEASGYDLDWQGDISVALLPLPHAALNDVTVTANGHSVVTVSRVSATINPWALLSGQVEITRVDVQEPLVTLTTSASGIKEWVTSAPPARKTAESSAGESGAQDDSALIVKAIDIEDGQFIWDDKKSNSRTVADHISARLSAGSMAGPFDAESQFEVAGQHVNVKVTLDKTAQSGQSLPVSVTVALPDMKARAEFSGATKSDGSEVSGDITLEADSLQNAATPLGITLPEGLSGRGLIAGKLVASQALISLANDTVITLGDVTYNGSLVVKNPSSVAPQISFDLVPRKDTKESSDPVVNFFDDLQIGATGSYFENTLTLKSADILLQGNDLRVVGKIKLKDQIPDLDLKFTSRNLNVDGVLSRVSALTSGDKAASAAAQGADSSAKLSSSLQGFSLPFSGAVAVDVRELKLQGQVYREFSADVIAKGQSLDITSFEVKLPRDAQVKISGQIGNVQDLSGLDLKFSAQAPKAEDLATLYHVTLPELPQPVGAVSIDGAISGSVVQTGFDVTAQAQKFTVKGAGQVADVLTTPVINSLSFDVRHPNLTTALASLGVDSNPLATSGDVVVAGDVAWADKSYRVTQLHGHLGSADFKGDVGITLADKPKIDGALDLGNIVFAHSSSGGFSVPSSASAKSNVATSSDNGAMWSREAIYTSWMRDFDAQIKITARSITHNLMVFTGAKLVANLEGGTLTIDDMSSGLFGGSAALNAVVTSGGATRDPLNLSATLTAHNVDAKSMVSALMGAPNDTVTGTLTSFETQLKATGLSPAALVQTLSGTGAAQGSNLVVKGVDAAQLAQAAKGSYKPLERAGTMFGSFGDGQTQFDTFDAAYNVANGVATFSKLNFDGPKAMLNSTGTINLPLWTIDLKNTMTVKNTDIPPFEFTIRGPLDNPAKAGGDVIENYLRGKVEKKVNKLIEDKLGKFLGGDKAAAAPTDSSGAAAVQPADPKAEAAKQAVKALQGLFGK